MYWGYVRFEFQLYNIAAHLRLYKEVICLPYRGIWLKIVLTMLVIIGKNEKKNSCLKLAVHDWMRAVRANVVLRWKETIYYCWSKWKTGFFFVSLRIILCCVIGGGGHLRFTLGVDYNKGYEWGTVKAQWRFGSIGDANYIVHYNVEYSNAINNKFHFKVATFTFFLLHIVYMYKNI